MKNSVEDYLNYIDKLYQREVSANQQSGITFWAVAVAVVYLCLQAAPYITAEKGLLNGSSLAINIYVHAYFSFSMCYLLTKSSYNPKNVSFRDYRVPQNIENLPLILLCIVIAMGLPSLACLCLLTEDTFQSYVGWMNFVVGVFALLGTGGGVVFGYWSFKKTGYPPSFFISRPQNSEDSYQGYINKAFSLVFLTLCIANIYSLFQIMSSEFLTEKTLMLGILLFLINIVITLLIISVRSETKTASLERIERDIILYNIDEDTIKERLEEEVLEVELGSWISKKLDSIKKSEREVIRELKLTSNIIDRIDLENKESIVAEIENHHKKIMELNSIYRDKSDKMSKWLKAVQITQLMEDDSVLKEIVSSTLSSLSEQLANINTSLDASLEKVDSGIEKLDETN